MLLPLYPYYISASVFVDIGIARHLFVETVTSTVAKVVFVVVKVVVDVVVVVKVVVVVVVDGDVDFRRREP